MEIKHTPMVLVILDGWGLSAQTRGNAIAEANTPNMSRLTDGCPHTRLDTSGEAVGLPEGQMGNSEVGHLNIGAGRIVYQELTRITRAVRDGSFFNNAELLAAVKHVQDNQSSLHLIGLLSDGGVHSHVSHLFALLELAKRHNLPRVYVHCFLDGRDVPPDNAGVYIRQLEEKCRELNTGRAATVMGRYYAMDRDKRWERTERAYRAMVLGEGLQAPTALAALEASYQRKEWDEFVQPTVIVDEQGAPVATVRDGDAVIFYNFRPDRARQITRAFVDEDFNGFARPAGRPRVHFTCMTLYDKTIDAPVAFRPHDLKNTLGEILSSRGLKQLRLAETEKYAHVTFFFNGGVEAPNPGEDRILIPSPKVATYDQKPEMSAYEVTDAFLAQLAADKYQVIIMNYANADMVGHTGDMAAAVQAVEAVDRCVGRVVEAVRQKNGVALITADHGNAEEMLDPNGHPHTAHTTDPVPFILTGKGLEQTTLHAGRLSDIAPTMLDLLGLPRPAEMTGQSLIAR
ncbi:2,3-bisphosphoglycerate-independent phosphoglycerate mutase [Desulfotomaculum copahuensis]|uniref:2,3-bisphosphoglycerate-independent phosphoglycerate mutase n=1 Tax=Desulfotomaculum copahuensis TaxID=1838280 RepID=A0A1B7LC14_9FIRM|nr:2,3-bisphosphoglycerate-independent phosphoglycerate mutase [Desulfotomaculum copahuensis]OAT80225.1 phosphoglycerate mutase (2,3-diphosphoglycerate-independent) [Desulfotomaculum copahuensis]